MDSLLCWSYSRHYVFTIGQKGRETVHVFFLGNFTANQVLNEYNIIEKKAIENGCNFFDRLELKTCLMSWAKHVNGGLDYREYNNRLLWLKKYNIVKNYVENPWAVNLKDMDSM
jgi:hypothetical protein